MAAVINSVPLVIFLLVEAASWVLLAVRMLIVRPKLSRGRGSWSYRRGRPDPGARPGPRPSRANGGASGDYRRPIVCGEHAGTAPSLREVLRGAGGARCPQC